MSDGWYYDDNGGQVGPLSLEELRHELAQLPRRNQIYVWRDGFAEWQLAKDVPELSGKRFVPPPLHRKKTKRIYREVLILGIVLIAGFISVKLGFDGQSSTPFVEPPLAAQEVEFCSIVEGATKNYDGLMRKWSLANEQKNGIVTSQLSKDMTEVYKARNQSVFKFAQQTRFLFENWTVVISEISSPDKEALRFTLRPVCSPLTKIHAAAPATPQTLELMSRKKTGDRLTISGRFVERYGGKSGTTPGNPVSAEEFEGSFTESGAMREPEYSTVITLVK